MLFRRTQTSNMYLGIIALFLVFAFLKIAQTITLPLVLSILLAFLLRPVIQFLRVRKVPPALASIISLSLVFLILVICSSMLIVPINDFVSKIPFYSDRLQAILGQFSETLSSFGIATDMSGILSQIDHKAVASLFGQGMASIMVFFKYGLLVFFLTLFLLIESERLSQKAITIFGSASKIPESIINISSQIQQYLFYKTLISLATGFLVYILLSAIGIHFAIVWALATFLLNFIPSVGSIIAGVPPILLALVQFESPLKWALITMLGILTIQLAIGSYLDPRIMGESLNISAFVVFFSMVFWGWIWGPVGMLIGVPLTVCAKVILMHNQSTRKIALLLEG
ncbi:MAG: AI-2E family transporter [Fibrobacterales bacterium]